MERNPTKYEAIEMIRENRVETLDVKSTASELTILLLDPGEDRM